MNLNNPHVRTMCLRISDILILDYDEVLASVDSINATQMLIDFISSKENPVIFAQYCNQKLILSFQLSDLAKYNLYGYIMRLDNDFIYGNSVLDINQFEIDIKNQIAFTGQQQLSCVLSLFCEIQSVKKFAFSSNPEQTLISLNQARVFTSDSGPQNEILYWRVRVAILEILEAQAEGNLYQKVAKMLTECKDNVKYLQQIIQLFANLQRQPLYSIAKQLVQFVQVLEQIFNMSSFYCLPEHITTLMLGLVNQLIIICKDRIDQQINKESTIYDINLEQFIITSQDILQINIQLQQTFKQFIHKNQIQISETNIFDKFDKFENRLKNITFVITSYQNFAHLHQTTIPGLYGLLESLESLISVLRNKPYNHYDDNQFEFDFDIYKNGIVSLENEMKSYLYKISNQKDIAQLISVLSQLNPILSRESMKESVLESYKMLLILFYQQLKNINQTLVTNKFNKIQEYNEQISKMITCRLLQAKIDKNFSFIKRIFVISDYQNEFAKQQIREQVQQQFGLYFRKDEIPECHLPLLFSFSMGSKIVGLYQNIQQQIVDCLQKSYTNICNTMPDLKIHLNKSLLVKTTSLKCNFSPIIIDFYKTGLILKQVKLPLPDLLKQLIVIFPTLISTRDILTNYCNKIKRIYIPQHMKLLVKPVIDSMFKKIQPGLHQFTWTSLSIENFSYQFESYIENIISLIAVLTNSNQKLIQMIQGINKIKLFPFKKKKTFLFSQFMSQYDIDLVKSVEFKLAYSQYLENTDASQLQLFVEECRNYSETMIKKIIQESLSVAKEVVYLVQQILSRYTSNSTSQNSKTVHNYFMLAIASIFKKDQSLLSQIEALPPATQTLVANIQELVIYYRQKCYLAINNIFINTVNDLSLRFGFNVSSFVSQQISAQAQKKQVEQFIDDPLVVLEIVFGIPQPKFAPDAKLLKTTFQDLQKLIVQLIQRLPLWDSNTSFQKLVLQSVGSLYTGDDQNVLVSSQFVNIHHERNVEIKSVIDQQVNTDRSMLTNRSQGLNQKTTRSINNDESQFIKELDGINPQETMFYYVGNSKTLFTNLASIEGRVMHFIQKQHNLLTEFQQFQQFWTDNKIEILQQFANSKPNLVGYQYQVAKLNNVIQQLNQTPNFTHEGIFLVNYKNIKEQILIEINQIKQLFCQQLNNKARNELNIINQEFISIEKLLKIVISKNNLEGVRIIMNTLDQLRELDSLFDIKVGPIRDMYLFLQQCEYSVNDSELELEDQLRYKLKQLQSIALNVQYELKEKQPFLLQSLTQKVQEFSLEVNDFVQDYMDNGPLKPDIKPQEASNKLDFYSQRFQKVESNFVTYTSNEQLFGLPVTDYPEIHKIKKEIIMLQKLYSLYNDVTLTISSFNEYLWFEANFSAIQSVLQDFQNKCARLPKQMRQWDAYIELKKKIDDFSSVFPVLQLLSHKAIIERHWIEISKITSCQQILQVVEKPDSFKLGVLLGAGIFEFRDEIEDLAISASKETDIEDKLKEVIDLWTDKKFVVIEYKTKGFCLLESKRISEINTLLEDSLMILSSLNSNKFNKPFKEDIQLYMKKLSILDEILKLWSIVQQNWTYLEAVFASGDISRQLPAEARKFNTLDKTWIKLMGHAQCNPGCIYLTSVDDALITNLPVLFQSLEETQKCLSGYLEQKRNLFPRFCFVSDAVLLEILGGQSDPNTIQPFLNQIFDALYQLTFEKSKRGSISHFSDKNNESVELIQQVMAQGNVEDWLTLLIKEMQKTIKAILKSAIQDTIDLQQNLSKLIDEFPAQVSLVFIQFVWTQTCESYFRGRCDKQEQRKYLTIVNKTMESLISLIKQDMTSEKRTNIETLITIQVHQKDIIFQLVTGDTPVRSVTDFEWLKQTRVYWNTDIDDCIIQITDINFTYQYEYLGINERLVITPLTDRCYITLAQAIGMFLGGAPSGPAGTGKTETCKDFGKTIGQFVVVFNCSDQMDYKGLGKIYKGIAQSGIYGDFDEFNRVELAVMSVAAQQIQCILQCIKQKKKNSIYTDGTDIKVLGTCAYFITMNPGYAGRVELLENLKVLFRSVSMMVPDKQIIMDVKLAAAGFSESKSLAKKFFILYQLCMEQLSQQRHYDFGLRNILSVLRTCGQQRRQYSQLSESLIILRVLRDMNRSKLVAQDIPLFEFLMQDLFPGVKAPDNQYESLENQIQLQVKSLHLELQPEWYKSVIQFYESFAVRHSVMLLGSSGAGKSTVINTLAKSLQQIQGKKSVIMKMNPKAITAPQMFGKLDSASGDWTDGIFSALWRKAVKAEYFTFIVLDGPVDAVWIENLNTVMDDNKLLTLANSDRIPMTKNMKLIIEVDNLDNASPATVSRAGMIYMSGFNSVGWRPFYNIHSQNWGIDLDLTQSIDSVYSFVLKENTLFKFQPLQYIRQFVSLFVSLLTSETADSLIQARHLVMEGFNSTRDSMLYYFADSIAEIIKLQSPIKINRLLFFTLIYSFGSILNLDQKKIFQRFVYNSLEFDIYDKPDQAQSMFNYFVNEAGEWQLWQSIIPKFVYNGNFNETLVPIVDNVSLQYLIQKLSQVQNILVVGDSGSGKSKIINSFLLQESQKQIKTINLSSMTTCEMLQKNFETFLEKRLGNSYGPPLNKQGLLFLDDLSSPQVNEWGDQTTNELTRQIIEQYLYYSLSKPGDMIVIEDLQYLAAMPIPGGGRNDIPNRLKSQFFCLFLNMPNSSQLDFIFGSFLENYFVKDLFSEDVTSLSEKLPKLMRTLLYKVKDKLLPTPEQFHYQFNLRDLSRITQSLIKADKDVINTPHALLTLWINESFRVFSDRCNKEKDINWFKQTLSTILYQDIGEFGANVYSQFANNVYFSHFMRDAPDTVEEDQDIKVPHIYEAANEDQLIQRLSQYQNDYNEKYRKSQIDLVLFDSCMQHITRLTRILFSQNSHALLIGVGGSGKQSVVKIASHITGFKLIQIQATKNYNLQNFDDDLRKIGREAFFEDIIFRFTDNDIKNEMFLERINNLLTVGEVPGLYAKDEREEIISDARSIFKKECPRQSDTNDSLWRFFLNKMKQQLHLVLSFSPGLLFRERCNKYPGIISGCIIDYYREWSLDALQQVAGHMINQGDNLNICLSQVHSFVYEIIQKYSEETSRKTNITPKSFLSFLTIYKDIYQKEVSQLENQQNKLKKGLQILFDAADDIAAMRVHLETKEKELAIASKKTEEMMQDISVQTKEAAGIKAEVQLVADECTKQAEEIKEQKGIAEAGLEKAMPLLIQAENALKSIEPSKIQTLRKLLNPPNLIQRILDSVLILLNVKLDKIQMDQQRANIKANIPSWQQSYTLMSGPFLQQLQIYNKDAITDEQCELLDCYLSQLDFTFEYSQKASKDVCGLYNWVVSMKAYHFIAQEVEPKRQKVRDMEHVYRLAMQKLGKAQQELADRQLILDNLQAQFDEVNGQKMTLQREAQLTQKRLHTASSLIQGLSGERNRWGQQIKELDEIISKTIGNSIVIAGFMNYCGPYNQKYRQILLEKWVKFIQENRIQYTLGIENYVVKKLVSEAQVGEWRLLGLPNDLISTQNGIITLNSPNYPLIIDPQNQGNSWIKNMYGEKLVVTTQSSSKFKMILENAVENGQILLIEDVEQDFDPILDPILEKQYQISGLRKEVRVGDQMKTVDENFRMFMTTRLPSPVYTPEMYAKTAIIDFAVSFAGLEAQLLSRTVNLEKYDLELQRIQLLEEVNQNKKMAQKLEEDLLYKLSNSTGNLLDDVELIDVLNNTKKTAEEVKIKLVVAVDTERKIEEARQDYLPIATRGALLYFVICDLTSQNHMYQTSLNQFTNIFDLSIQDSPQHQVPNKRINFVLEYLTEKAFTYILRGLYEKDKQLLTLKLTLQIELQKESITPQEFNIFVKGGSSIEQTRSFPVWCNDKAWRNVTALQQIPVFHSVCNVCQDNDEEWKQWFMSDVEQVDLPSDYQDRVSQFQRLLLIRCFRDDRTILAAQHYIDRQMGPQYTNPANANYEQIFNTETSPGQVVTFLLSLGSDPTQQLEVLAKNKKLELKQISMGQGQEANARRLITECILNGNWIMINNSHLAINFMQEIDQLLLDIQIRDSIFKKIKASQDKDKSSLLKQVQSTGYFQLLNNSQQVNSEFRLILTTEHHKKFPITLLQKSIKLTNEPPTGLRANMMRVYQQLTQDFLDSGDKPQWLPMLYATTFIHAAIIERKKFGTLGWCCKYEFGLHDFNASAGFIQQYLYSIDSRKNVAISWKTVWYMIAEVHYGGRITDDYDRRLMMAYTQEFLNNRISDQEFKFAPRHTIPRTNNLQQILDYIQLLPSIDTPNVFQMSANADLAFREVQANEILHNLLDGKKLNTNINIQNIIDKLPELLVSNAPASISPLDVFLHQEIQRINQVLQFTKYTLTDLQKAIDGTAIMSEQLESVLTHISDGSVPQSFVNISFPSKSFTFWISDLSSRHLQYKLWQKVTPKIFQISGFFNPTGFLTAIKQELARRNQWPLDRVVLQTQIQKPKSDQKTGYFIEGLSLQGAAWDSKKEQLIDQPINQLFSSLPLLRIDASDGDIPGEKGIILYECPVYKNPSRTGLNYIFTIKLKSSVKANSWILKGVAVIANIQ
ncbi:Outer-arm dynein gamma [Spironucleus salmonicida]|uniref:Dynein heavy chain n=1 Tax=Spironucleus salmonicida TaxID=348837 RepID=V6LNA2_9EUKA|nr:Outer-arm dynein gamma [Spironucleus salmonicida]|eukprot:EST42199.1 Dynein heavy chain [Spironucleus salmonicida]